MTTMTDLQEKWCTHPHARVFLSDDTPVLRSTENEELRGEVSLRIVRHRIHPLAWCEVCDCYVFRKDGDYSRLRARRCAPRGALSLCEPNPQGYLSISTEGGELSETE